MRNTKSVLLLMSIVFLTHGFTASGYTCGGDQILAENFLTYNVDPEHFSDPGALDYAFAVHVNCLKVWAEEGGEEDGLPLSDGMVGTPLPRLAYRMRAVQIIDALILNGMKDASIAPWLLKATPVWPERMRWEGFKVLVDLEEKKAIPLIRQEASRVQQIFAKGIVWKMFAMISPETAAAELEKLAVTEDDYKMLGFAVLAVDHPNSIPTLKRLVEKNPGKAAQYKEQIKRIEAVQSKR